MSGYQIHQRTVGPFAEHSYVLACTQTGHAIVIDPGEAGPVLAVVEEHGYTVDAIVNTHGHLDHVLGVAEVREALGVPFHLHPADAPLVAAVAAQAAMFGLPAPAVPTIDEEIVPGEPITVGELTVEVVFTPGHSPGHVAFILPGATISGDCLFAGSIGRTDLPGGDLPTLLASIRDRLLVLPDETQVHAGHMGPTTIGRERATNPFLRDLR